MTETDPKTEAPYEQSVRTAPCPMCKKPTHADWRPFCSKRCADVDLSRWLNGAYAIPVADADEDEDGDDATLDILALKAREEGNAGS